MAEAAIQYRLCRPLFSKEDDSHIYIEGGRNLVVETRVPTYIPNDTQLCYGREGSLALLTGPNASGKSVYLRQIAQIAFLAHVGSFVPATAVKLSPCDRIMTRIQSRESVYNQQSSFALDCSQVARMVSLATKHTLCVIDEFGKGTDSKDGAAIVSAVIKTFLGRGEDCPKVIVSTHFSELRTVPLLEDHPNLRFLTMDLTIVNQSRGASLVYLYQYANDSLSSITTL